MGADVNASATLRYDQLHHPGPQPIGGITPLHQAAFVGDANVADLLITHGAEVDARTELGVTPLHCAAGYRRVHEMVLSEPCRHYACHNDNVAELLIRKGCDVNARDNDGATALYYALQAGYEEVAKSLSAAGAQSVTVRVGADQAVLRNALTWNDVELIRILLANGVKPDERDADGNTLLHVAVRNRNQAMAELLIAHGADTNAQNHAGATPLCYAASNGCADLALVLLANGGNPNTPDNGGNVALHAAALRGHREVIEVLVAHGADVNIKNSRGRTPADEAARRGHKDIAPMLTAKTPGSSIDVRSDRGEK